MATRIVEHSRPAVEAARGIVVRPQHSVRVVILVRREVREVEEVVTRYQEIEALDVDGACASLVVADQAVLDLLMHEHVV
ncbi:hypothetical protein D3C87_1556700 [compost metagenome]